MNTKKRRRKRKNIKLTNHLTVIIICIISIFAGFFIGKINSSSAEISSLEKSNIENEATLKAKQTELSKLKEKLQEEVYSIEDLERTISELNTQLEQSNPWGETYTFEETVDSYAEIN
ncbi:MAG: hypothetical protein ACLTGX_04900 [Clostridium sp.]